MDHPARKIAKLEAHSTRTRLGGHYTVSGSSGLLQTALQQLDAPAIGAGAYWAQTRRVQ